jgi:hypothetical protein
MMTLEEAEQFLFFVRDEMLKDSSYSAETVWMLPEIALLDVPTAKLVGRWYSTTKKDMRKYIETRLITHIEGYHETRRYQHTNH